MYVCACRWWYSQRYLMRERAALGFHVLWCLLIHSQYLY